MPLNDLLNVEEDVLLIEDSFDALEMGLKSLDYLGRLRSLPPGAVEAAIMVGGKKGEALGAAFKNRHHDGDFWFLVPYPAAPAMRKQTEALAGDVLGSGVVGSVKRMKVDPAKLRKALREYLSCCLVERALCECEKEMEPLSFARNEERSSRITSLLRPLAEKGGYRLDRIDALEICCGNGMSTAPLREMFRSVLSIDNDKCALCNGLYHGTLEPDSTMLADAMELSKYGLGTFGAVVGFMLGTIYEFNRPVWRTICAESFKALQQGGFLLLTVRTQEEMDFIAEAYASMGVDGKVIDNRQNDSIYDSCAFFAIKK
jgi:hypothetical protein